MDSMDSMDVDYSTSSTETDYSEEQVQGYETSIDQVVKVVPKLVIEEFLIPKSEFKKKHSSSFSGTSSDSNIQVTRAKTQSLAITSGRQKFNKFFGSHRKEKRDKSPTYCRGNGEPLKTVEKHKKRNLLTLSLDSSNFAQLMEVTTHLTIEHPLPVTKLEKSCNLISSETVVDLMNGKYSSTIAKFEIIDCRYLYEFVGGHIKNAKNIPPSELRKLSEFFDPAIKETQNTVLIFHCEFSSKRGPAACQAMREYDRTLNSHRYPYLFYPYIYVMEGGYQTLFSKYPEFCEGGYVEMKDKNYCQYLKENKKKDKAYKSLGDLLISPRQSVPTASLRRSYSNLAARQNLFIDAPTPPS